MKKKGNKRQYNIFLIVGIVIVLTAIFIAVFCPIITKYDPLLVNVEERITAPTGQHKLGTDEMGRDVLSRMFFGVRASMIIGVSVAIISTMAGIIVGVIAGYYNKVDNVLNAGKDIYAKNDLDLAKEYLEKSNYNGEPIVIVQGKDDTVESQGAEDLKSQLEKIGFNVEVELYDRATVMEKRSQKEGWAIHLTYFSVWNADPQVWSAWVGTNGWITNWDDEDSKKMDDIFARMLVELDEDARYEIVQEWYDAFWEYVPYVKTIDYSRMNATNAKLQGYANYCQPFFWNTWVEE